MLRLLYGPAHNLYVTSGKVIALTIWTFVSRVMSVLLNTLSRFVTAFLPRSKRLGVTKTFHGCGSDFMAAVLISWLQLPSSVTLEPKKRKSVTPSTFSLFICHQVMGQIPWS